MTNEIVEVIRSIANNSTETDKKLLAYCDLIIKRIEILEAQVTMLTKESDAMLEALPVITKVCSQYLDERR